MTDQDTIHLYHCKDARSLRPLWTLEELGVPYRLTNMGFPPRFEYEGYLEINPLGTVPTLIDGEMLMTESAGICEYLVARHGPTPLAVVKDEADFGLYLNWLHRSDATLTFPLALVLRYSKLEPPERRSQQVVDDYTQWFFSRLRSVESGLEGRDYLCAGRFTIADICVGYALLLATDLELDFKFGPNTKAFLARIKSRPAFARSMEKQAELSPAPLAKG